MSSPWPAAPNNPALEPGWAHVYFFPLDLDDALLARLHHLLSVDERARAARYKVEHARRQFVAARGQMRSILAGYTKYFENLDKNAAKTGQNHSPTVDNASIRSFASQLRFDVAPQGKPYLPGSRLRFNLSHAAHGALLAVTLEREIGVDIEPASRVVDYAQMAPRFFAPAEAEALLALPPAGQPNAFLRCWTRKEAYIKARGGGLSIPLHSFTVTFLEGQPALLTAPDPGWTLYALDPGPAFAAALVVEGALEGLRYWSWDVSRIFPKD